MLVWLGVPSKGWKITWVLGSRIKTGQKELAYGRQVLEFHIKILYHCHCKYHLDPARGDSKPPGLPQGSHPCIGFGGLVSAGFTHRAGMSLRPGCSDGSFLFVFLAWGHLIFTFFRRIIYSLAFFGLSGTFLHSDFYGTYDWFPPSSIVEEIRRVNRPL